MVTTQSFKVATQKQGKFFRFKGMWSLMQLSHLLGCEQLLSCDSMAADWDAALCLPHHDRPKLSEISQWRTAEHSIKLLWEWYLGRLVQWLPVKVRACVVFEPYLQGRKEISMKEQRGHLHWNFDFWPVGGFCCPACDGSSASPAYSHQACSNSDGCATWKRLLVAKYPHQPIWFSTQRWTKMKWSIWRDGGYSPSFLQYLNNALSNSQGRSEAIQLQDRGYDCGIASMA